MAFEPLEGTKIIPSKHATRQVAIWGNIARTPDPVETVSWVQVPSMFWLTLQNFWGAHPRTQFDVLTDQRDLSINASRSNVLVVHPLLLEKL